MQRQQCGCIGSGYLVEICTAACQSSRAMTSCASAHRPCHADVLLELDNGSSWNLESPGSGEAAQVHINYVR
jgi:hypothetical protein